jgi:RNA polymerase sigma-70 factor (ECF subfamily)
MTRLAQGDPEALRDLMARHAGPVLAFLLHATGDRAAAEDLVQETFLRLFRNAAAWRPELGLRPWLFTIARNLALGLRRHRAIEARPLPARPSAPHPPPALVEERELRRKAEEAVQAIDEPFRTTLVLCVLQGLSYEEAAAVCGVPPKTISSRLARARARFRELMDPYLQGDRHGL